MAKTVSVLVTDDLDGSPDAETVAFGFDARSYEIDLGKKNRARLQKSLQPFMEAGRRTAVRRTAKAPRAAGSRTGPGSGARLGRRAGPEGIRARSYQRRGNDQIRRRSLTAGSAGPDPPGNHFPGDLAWPGKGCAS